MRTRHVDTIEGPALAIVGAVMIVMMTLSSAAWADASRPIEIGCQRERPDEILDIICKRVVNEVRILASDAGHRVIDVSGRGPEAASSGALRTVRISLDATQPPGRFDIKQIDAKLTGTYGLQAAEPWTSELSAKGVPRDLVHPVADALVMRVSAFLASSPGE